MKGIINRKVILWIQDEYELPEGSTVEDLKTLDSNEGKSEKYFVERDIFKFIDDMEVTNEVEYKIESDEEDGVSSNNI